MAKQSRCYWEALRERAISLESGKNVARALEQAGAHVLPIDPALAGWMTQLNEVSFAFNLLHGPGGEEDRKSVV